MVMEFEKQRANRVIVVLDTYLPVGSSGKLQALEHGVSTAASLLTFFNKRSYQTGLAAFAPKLVKVKPDSGRRHYFTLMEVLARLNPSTRGLDELVDRLDARQLRDSMVFMVTLKDNLRNAQAMKVLSQYSPVVKHICVTGDNFTKYVVLPEEGPESASIAPSKRAVKTKDESV